MDSLLFVMAAGQAVLISIQLCIVPGVRKAATTMLAIVLIIFAGLFLVVAGKNANITYWPFRLDLALTTALIPSLWFQTSAACGASFSDKKRNITLLVSSLVGSIGVSAIVSRYPEVFVAILAMLLFTIVRSIAVFARHIEAYDQTHSSSDLERLGWLRNAYFGIALVGVLGVAQAGAEILIAPQVAAYVTTLIPICFISLNIYLSIKLLRIRSAEPIAVLHQRPTKRNQLSSIDLESVQEKLEKVMKQDLIFRDSRLQLRDVSERTGLDELAITEAIRRGLGRNFFDYVNAHRIKYAQTALTETNKSVSLIMNESGFNSKSSFYTEFKKRNGQSPAGYRKDYAV